MQGCLIVFQDFHPLLKASEVITHSYSLLNLFPPVTTPLITIKYIEDSNSILPFLYQGQKVAIPHNGYTITKEEEQFYIVFRYNELTRAYINIQLEQILPYKERSISIEQAFIIKQATKDALERGINNIYIAMYKIIEDDLAFKNLYETLFLEIQELIPPEREVIISLILDNIKDLGNPWVQEVQNKFSQSFFKIEFVPIEIFYQVKLGLDFSHPIDCAVFITSYQHQTNAMDYDFYLNYVKENNIPYDIICNEISTRQNLPVNKEAILDYFYYKLSLLKILV